MGVQRETTSIKVRKRRPDSEKELFRGRINSEESYKEARQTSTKELQPDTDKYGGGQ